MTKQLAIPQAPVQPIEVGKKQTIQLSKGQHASVQDLVGGSAKDASNVVATRKGSDLTLKFADGTELQVPNYYTECAGNACSIAVGGDKGAYLISADGAAGAGAAAVDGSQLVYAYGEQSSLMAMAGADAGVSSALSGLGAGTVSYVPAASLAAGALGAGVGLSAGALAGVVAGGVALAAAGGGGGGGGAAADTTAPTAGTLSLLNYTDDGVSSSDGIGTDNTFDLSLSGQEAGATVAYQVSRDGGTTWTATTAVQSGLTDGGYQFRAQVTGAAGNRATTTPLVITVDTTAPDPSLELQSDTGEDANDRLTNNGLVNVFLGEDANSWQYSTDGGTSWNIGSGSSFTLAEGVYGVDAVQVRQSDLAGNISSSRSLSPVTVDTTAPTAGTLGLLDYTDTGTGTYTTDGISSDNAFDLALSGFAGGTAVAQVSTDGINWTNTPVQQSNLADGSYQFRAVVTDAAGNNAFTAPVLVTVDTTAPAAGTLILLNHTDSGASSSDGISNDHTFNLSLSGQESGTTVVYQESTDGGTTWSDTPAEQSFVSNGSYLYRAVVTDGAGNSANTEPLALTVDTTDPNAGTLSLANHIDGGTSNTDGISSDNTFDLSLSGQETGATVAYQVSRDGGNTFAPTTAVQSGLNDGIYQFRAVVTDLAGNSDTTKDLAVTVDTIAPAAGILSLSSYNDDGLNTRDRIGSDNTFDLSLSGQETGATVVYEVSTDGGTTWSDTTAAQTGLADGTYRFRAQVTDVAGNSATTTTFVVTVDTNIPVAGTLSLTNYNDSGASSTDGISTDNVFDLTLSGEETGATVVYQVSEDGGATWATTTSAQSSLLDGTYQFRAVVTGSANTVATTTPVLVTVDTTAPAAGTLILLNHTDSGASSSDGISNDHTFNLSLSGQESGTTVVYQESTDGGTTWSDTPAEQSFVSNGSYLYRAVVTDGAGNSANTAPLALTVDTTDPNAGTLSLANHIDGGTSNTDGISSDNTFDLSLSGQETGATVAYQVSRDGGNTFAPTTAVQSGLNDGIYQFRAVVTDLAGNSDTTKDLAVTVDTIAPAAGILSLSSYNDDGLNTRDRIGSDNTFDLSLSGQETGATVVYEVSTDGGTTWSDTTAAQTGLADGTYRFRAQVTDVAGNSATTTTFVVTVDTNIPVAGTLSLTNYNDSGASSTDGISTDNVFDLTLSGEETGATVVYQVSQDGGATWATTTSAQSSLLDGNYQFRAVVTGAASTVATTAPVLITVDNTAPGLPTVELNEDTGANSTDRITENGLIDVTVEAGASWEYSTNGGIDWNDGQGTSFTLAAGEYGEDAVQVRQNDLAGNVSSSRSLSPVTVEAGYTSLPYDIGNGDRNGDGVLDGEDFSETDGQLLDLFDDPLTWRGASSSATVWIGDQIVTMGFTPIEDFDPRTEQLVVPLTVTSGGANDAVGDGEFSVYYGTFDGLVFKVTSTPGTTADPRTATHTMILYDNDSAVNGANEGLVQQLGGYVIEGVYAEAQWNLENAGTPGAILVYKPLYSNAFDSELDTENVLYGTAGVDIVYGEDGIDIIYGVGGDDTIYGGHGQDRLVGGAEGDDMAGGHLDILGNFVIDNDIDTYVYNNVGDSNWSTDDAYDVVTLSDGDIFDFAQAVEAVRFLAIGEPGVTTLASLNTQFQNFDDGIANVEAMLFDMTNNSTNAKTAWLVVDANEDQTITADDYVIRIELDAASNALSYAPIGLNLLLDANVSVNLGTPEP